MADKTQDPLAPQIGAHPLKATFTFPHVVLDAGWLTFDDPAGETPHAGVNALLAIPGLTIVSLHHNEVSLLRDPECDWDAILPQATSVLRAQFLDQPAFQQPVEAEGEAEADDGAPAEDQPADS